MPDLNSILEAAQSISIDPARIRIENDKIVISDVIEMGMVVYLKTLLRYPVEVDLISYQAGHNWAYVKDENQVNEVPWKDNWLKTSL